MIPKQNFDGPIDFVSNINTAVSILNWVNPYPIVKVGVAVFTNLFGISTHIADESNISEAEAIYNLRVEIAEFGTFSDDGEIFKADPRINEDKCGAEQINFSNYESPTIYLSDNLAPYHMTFKHIINQFGTHDKEGTDQLTMYIYSDYLGSGIRFPVFEMINNEMLYFEDINIPCESEIVVSLQNEERLLESM